MRLSLIRMIFRKYRKIMVSMLMIAALGVALTNGMYNAWESLDVSLRSYLAAYGISDASISTEVTDQAAVEKISQVDGIARVIARMTGSSQIITPSGSMLTAQIISLNKEDFLQLYHWPGSLQPKGDYVLADNWFARHNGISAGDTVQIRTGEDEYRPFTVAAVVSAPETLERTKLQLGGKYYPDFGFLYAPISLLETETDKEKLRMTEEWESKKEEYLQAEKEFQDSRDEVQAELDRAREELEKQEKEFEEKREELKGKIQELTTGRVQLILGRKELADAEESVEEKEKELEQQLDRAMKQLLEAEDRQADLTEVRNDLYNLLVQMEDAKGRLRTARDQITKKESEVMSTLQLLKRAKALLDQARSGSMGIDMDEVEAALKELGVPIGTLDLWIAQAESGLSEMHAGRERIQRGIVEINNNYLPEIQAYLEETEQGLEAVGAVYAALRDGVAGMEAGLKSISDFKQEAPDKREEINGKLREVEEGLQAIYDGLSEGETALAEGRKELEGKTAEADEAYAEAADDLAEGAKSLQEARDELDAWEGYTPLRNEFLIWFDPDVTDPRAVLKAAEAALDIPVVNSELYEDSGVAKTINDNVEPMWSMSVMVPPLFTGIMMLVLFMFLSIMIRQSRQSIGILRALGFSKAQVRRIFSIACVILMAAASVLGGGFSLGITYLFNMYYKKFFSLPAYTHTFSWTVFGLAAAGFILLGLAAAALSSASLSRIRPVEAMTRRVSVAPKIGRLSRLLLRRVEPLSKFSLLSLRRNPFRFITSVVCVSGAVSIIFAALSFIVSKNEVLTDSFDRKLLYDAQVFFDVDDLEEDTGERIRQIGTLSAAERFWAREEDLSFRGSTVRGTLLFLEPDTQMVTLTDMRGGEIAYPRTGIVLSDSFAKALGAKEGDMITVGETETAVSGISHQMTMDFQYLPAAEKDLYRKADQTGWMIRLQEGADDTEIASRVYREKGYQTTLLKTLMRKGYSDLYSTFDLYIGIIVTLCGIVGIFIVVNTGWNNLNEQMLPLSVLRAIGFRQGQISARWFLQSLLYLICSLLIGYLAGQIVAGKALELMNNSVRHLEYIPAPFQYVWTAISTFAFLLAGHWITMRSMRKWNLTENIKARE